MVRYIIIIIIALFLGFSPKRLSNREIYRLAFIDLALIITAFGVGILLGYNFKSIALLEVNTIIVSFLRVMYAITLGLFIKYLFNIKKTE